MKWRRILRWVYPRSLLDVIEFEKRLDNQSERLAYVETELITVGKQAEATRRKLDRTLGKGNGQQEVSAEEPAAQPSIIASLQAGQEVSPEILSQLR